MNTNDVENSNSRRPADPESSSSVTSYSEQNSPAEQTEEQLDHAARTELLAEENRRLRSEYTRAQQSKYRRTAIGLAAVGCLAVLGGILFPNGREVLFTLGATGLFGGILTLYLTPTKFVAADVGERVYTAMATNERAIADELGIASEQLYVPDENTARLYLPQSADFVIPDARDGPIIVNDESRGLLLEVTGAALFEEFERALTGELAETPTVLAEQLADGIVEQFELATAIDSDVDLEDGRATFEVTESAFGDLDRIDHPIVSFLAVGVAVALDRSVSVEVTADDKTTDWLVTCRWAAD